MKIRLGKLTGSPEQGSEITGIYWNDRNKLLSGVSYIDYTDKKGRARRIWPDSDILHIQSISLQTDDEIGRIVSAFSAQRAMMGDESTHVMNMQVNGKTYDMFDTRNTLWDAAASTLYFLRNSGPMPGRINRGDYATIELICPKTVISRGNNEEYSSWVTLMSQLAPVTTCEVYMRAGWRRKTNNSSDSDRGHVLLNNESGVKMHEVKGRYSEPSGGKKGGGGSVSFWAGTKRLKGVKYNGEVQCYGPAGTCSVEVTYPAYTASFTVRIIDVVVA